MDTAGPARREGFPKGTSFIQNERPSNCSAAHLLSLSLFHPRERNQQSSRRARPGSVFF